MADEDNDAFVGAWQHKKEQPDELKLPDPLSQKIAPPETEEMHQTNVDASTLILFSGFAEQ